ncbi:MAG: hypothetical protein AB7S70_00555 [Hyphomicrobium sp.]|uniref:head-tail joining protein n=1 Tax=Hyphomicrobium sp. TaxID=82 RepID=UPI003D13B38B
MFDFDVHTNTPLFSIYARPVTYTPSNKLVAANPLNAIFDREHEIVLDEMANSELRQAGHSTTVPVLTVRLADFVTKPAQGDTVVVDGEGSFTVWDVQPDGEGCADLVLRKV